MPEMLGTSLELLELSFKINGLAGHVCAAL